MRELQECLDIKRQIDELDLSIYELKAVITSPKNQIITGMPRGGNTKNAIERYIVRAEFLEQQKKGLKREQKRIWRQALRKMGKVTEEEKRLLYLRCMNGLPWKKCVLTMNENNEKTEWTISRAFRVYGKFSKIN